MGKMKTLLTLSVWGMAMLLSAPGTLASDRDASWQAGEADREVRVMAESVPPAPVEKNAPPASGVSSPSPREKVGSIVKEPELRQWMDVPYGTNSPMQRMDIYLPDKGVKPYPVIMILHDRGEDKRDIGEDWRRMGLDRGYAVLCVNWRETSEARFPADVMDVKAAVRYLKANASKYGLDASHIAVWGSSYGGKLASFLGTTSSRPELEDSSIGGRGQSSRVNVVVAWFPELDDLHMDTDFSALGILPALYRNEIEYGTKVYGAPIQSIPELVAFANPIRYVGPDASSFFLIHGASDNFCPVSQSAAFAESLRHTIGSNNVTFLSLENRGHQLKSFLGKDIMDQVFRFMDKRLKVQPKKKKK